MRRLAIIFIIIASLIVCWVFLIKPEFTSNKDMSKNDWRLNFELSIIDADGPRDPWGKSVGDINGDGLTDLIVGGHSAKEPNIIEKVIRKLGFHRINVTAPQLVWYENPCWKKHLISDKYQFGTDHEVADIDKDGHNDVLSITDSGLFWFRNPDWASTMIDSRLLHDIEIADFDGDGDFDAVARNQSGFNHNNGNQLHFYRQDSPAEWHHFTMEIPPGEGLKVADMDGDGKLDVVVNCYWYHNTGVFGASNPWPKHSYSLNWDWQDVFIDVADISGDGRLDIVLAPAEPQGERYRISWFEAPSTDNSQWTEHVIDSDVETVHHFIAARDMDNDGNIDIVTAEMHQGKYPREITVYWNRASEKKWQKQVIASTGSHSMRVVDIDNDGDIDLFGANWSGENQSVELWVNKTSSKTLSQWNRHVIDGSKPWRSVFILTADLDNDGYKDVVTGGWWYRNPGKASGTWERKDIGELANNTVIIQDFDRDGHLDILASQWRDYTEWKFFERVLRKLHIGSHPIPVKGGFVWARNDGKGHFNVIDNVEAGEGDFLQGAAAMQSGGSLQIALSWHKSGFGCQMLSVPDDPVKNTWKWRRISKVSQDEALTSNDIDGDGDPDLMLGTKWLRNEGNGKWLSFNVFRSNEMPDRNRLADINQDGKLDVVVGYEAISTLGKVAWYEQGNDPTNTWTEHIIGTAVGPMSLDVGDLFGDGDLYVVVGEHNLKNPEAARLLLYEKIDENGLNWRVHVIYKGDEHHDGAQFVDIDNDGDLDIVSIGWNHNMVVLYENKNS